MDSAGEADFLPRRIRQWASEPAHQELLNLVATRFATSGEWPAIRELQRELVRGGAPLNLRAAMSGMPRELGWIDYPGETMVLSLFGLYMAPPARGLLEHFMDATRLAVRRYASLGDDDPVLTSNDLRTGLSLEGAELVAVSRVIMRDSPIWGGGPGDPPGEWTRAVDDRIVDSIGVESIDEYVRMRAARQHLADEPALVAMPGQPRHNPRFPASPAIGSPRAEPSARHMSGSRRLSDYVPVGAGSFASALLLAVGVTTWVTGRPTWVIAAAFVFAAVTAAVAMWLHRQSSS